jgi:hypothetical protein
VNRSAENADGRRDLMAREKPSNDSHRISLSGECVDGAELLTACIRRIAQSISDQLDDAAQHSGDTRNLSRGTSHLVRIPEAARITGSPESLLRKSFMREEKRPINVPPPPPHKRVGRAIYILADQLPEWIQNLDTRSGPNGTIGSRRRGRPTVVERIARRGLSMP